MEIKGYGVLPLSLPRASAPHYVFYKKHEVKTDGAGRLLFLINLPIETSASVMKKFLQNVAIGATLESFVASSLTDCNEDVFIDLTRLTSDLKLPKDQLKETASRLPRTCGVATFVDKSAYQLAFNALKKLSHDGSASKWPIPSLGSAYFISKLHDQVLERNTLTHEVAQALANFNKAEKESAEALQEQTQLVDDDGFTLVVGSHRKTKAGIMGKQKLAQTVELDKARTKMKKKEKDDFYRYQLRQKKKEEMNDLLQKFKQDQERVKTMRDKKRFRPY